MRFPILLAEVPPEAIAKYVPHLSQESGSKVSLRGHS